MRDQERLAALYAKFGPVIFARCRRLLGDDAAAEDATHETFLRIHRHLESTPREALAWIYRIATNLCLNELRDRKRRAEPRDDLPEAIGANVEVALADRDLAERLIRRADPKISAVAWLCYVDGMDQEEVAEVLGLSRRTVVNHLSKFNRNALKFVRRVGG
jgi:RNA polymerase sigma-70 factor (ECF subfamily)